MTVLGGGAARHALIVCAVLAALAALHLTAPVTAPVAFAIFIIALVWPLQGALEQWVPQIVALAVSVAAALVALFACGWLVFWGFGQVANWVIANAARLQALYLETAGLLEARGLYAAGLLAEQINVTWLIRVLRDVAGGAQGVARFALVTLVFVVLGLLEVRDAAARLSRPEAGRFGAEAVALAAAIARKLQTYMLVRGAMSALTGVGVALLAWVVGLDLARAWGVIAFVLNFIPFIGSFVATLLPTAFAVAQFESFGPALAVFLGLNAVQLVIGSYLEPRMTGKALSVSPFMVLFSVFFWALVWGIAGAFIGVPILIGLVTGLARFEPTRGLALALSAEKG